VILFDQFTIVRCGKYLFSHIKGQANRLNGSYNGLWGGKVWPIKINTLSIGIAGKAKISNKHSQAYDNSDLIVPILT